MSARLSEPVPTYGWYLRVCSPWLAVNYAVTIELCKITGWLKSNRSIMVLGVMRGSSGCEGFLRVWWEWYEGSP